MLAVLCTGVTGCIEDDFTTSPSDVLAFSTDTIAFDTIFTDLATPTAKLMVYNRNKKMVKISSIRVKGESDARFYLNVDGVKGSEFHDVEIRGEDSMYVFVQAFVDPIGDDEPLMVEDKLEFVTNNTAQDIVIRAWGQDVERLYAPQFDTDAVIRAGKPYVIFDTMRVAAGVTLTIEPGVTLHFHDKAAMAVDGTLKAVGTREKRIHFRGDRIDKVVGDTDFDIMSGQWGGIAFGPDSYDNEMSYVYVRSSSDGIRLDSCDVSRQKFYALNSVFHNSSSDVFTVRHSNAVFEGCEFSEARGASFYAIGGVISAINCTFANYYLFSAIDRSIVTLEYLMPADKRGDTPLMIARFDNCIIYGNSSDINIGDLTGCDVLIRNTLLRSDGTDDANFINCRWGGDPKFFTIREEYIFDYRLHDTSDAIALGNPEVCSERMRYDLYGNDRLASQGIDAGAYVWIKEPETNNQ